MKNENKEWLDNSRHHLESSRQGWVRHLDVETLRRIMLEEFDTGYGPVDESNANTVFQLIEDIYAEYDAWDEQPGEEGKSRYTVELPKVIFPDEY